MDWTKSLTSYRPYNWLNSSNLVCNYTRFLVFTRILENVIYIFFYIHVHIYVKVFIRFFFTLKQDCRIHAKLNKSLYIKSYIKLAYILGKTACCRVFNSKTHFIVSKCVSRIVNDWIDHRYKINIVVRSAHDLMWTHACAIRRTLKAQKLLPRKLTCENSIEIIV